MMMMTLRSGRLEYLVVQGGKLEHEVLNVSDESLEDGLGHPGDVVLELGGGGEDLQLHDGECRDNADESQENESKELHVDVLR